MPIPGSPYKDSLQLSVGVGLSAEQVAALTHDIVWLEEAEVNGEKVLVPVLYLAQAENRLGPTGALIMGQDVSLISGGDLNNAGTLRASNNLSASAGNLSNSGLIQAGNRLDLLADDSIRNAAGGIIAGRDVSLTALAGDVINERSVTRIDSAQSANRTWTTSFADSAARIEAANSLDISAGRDVSNLGGVLQSRGDLFIGADRDVNIASVEVTNGQLNGRRYYSETTTQLGAEASAGRDLDISAGRDLNAVASRLDAARDAALSAGRDVTLASAADESHSYSNTRKISSQKDHVEQQGTELTAGGDVSIAAGQDLALKASSVSASGEAYLYAGRDVSLVSEQDSDYSYYRKTKTSSSGLSSTTKTRVDSSSSTTQAGSLVSADKIAIRAGQDIAVQGSDVASTNGTSLLAGRNVLIDGATESFETSHAESKKKSGLMSSGGIGVTLGSSSLKTTQDDHTEQTRGSTIGSVLGNVDIQAGKDLTIRGSDLVAGKDINLIGQNVSILEAQNRNRSEETREQKKSGLTLALSGSVGSAVNTAYESSKEARHEDDSRLAALKGIQAGLTGYQAWQASQQGGGMSADTAGQFVGIAISLGSQQSKSKTVQEQSIAQGSTLTAGNNLNILATGAGKVGEDGDIRIQGSQLKAGQDVMLAANRDLLLEAASNTQKLDGKNSSSGGNIGASIGFGSGGAGISIFANGNKGTGFEHGNGTTWTESTVDAGRQVTLISGRDTSLIGAQVNGEQITAKVGRDLTLRSLQDTDEYRSEQKNVSGGASFTFGTMTGSGYVSVDKSKIHSNYDSVQEQTGLYAGKGGYDIEVGKHTQLDGAVISSTANADKNRLSTDTLGWRDIRNEADYKTQQQGISASTGGNEGSAFFGNMPNGMVTAYTHGDSDSGTTHSAISAGTIDIRNGEAQQQDVASLSRDVEHANGSISPIFDKEKEQRRLQEVQLIAQIGSQSMDIIRTNGEMKANEEGRKALEKDGKYPPGEGASAEEIKKYNEALVNSKAYQDVMREYGTGSNYQQAAQAVTAALQYLAGGDIGGAVAGASAPYVATLIKQQTGDNDTARIMAQAVLGAIVANAQGNSGAAGAAGAATGELIAATVYPNKKPEDLTESERQIVSALSTLAAGMAGGLATGDSAGVVAAAGAGKTAVENNQLSTLERVSLVQEQAKYQAECQGSAAGSSNCRQLAASIQEKLEKDRSVLQKDLIAPASDMSSKDIIVENKPGDVVPCSGSANGFCQVTDQVVNLGQGSEWRLIPVSDQLAAYTAGQNAANAAQQLAEATQWTADAFDAGCGSFGLSGVACSAYRAAGGANPISGAIPTTEERILSGAATVLTSLGIYGTVAGGAAKVPKGTTSSTETYFRVEGGGSGLATSQNRIIVNTDGSIRINPGCSGQLCVSVGSADHASYFLTNKRPDGSVVVFEVDAALHKQIMDSAIPQRPIPGIPRDPTAPKIVDPNQPGVALELQKVWESLLEKGSSNARIYTHDEFLKVFSE